MDSVQDSETPQCRNDLSANKKNPLKVNFDRVTGIAISYSIFLFLQIHLC